MDVKMELWLIVAIASNGTIGKEGELPWHYPKDLKYFSNLTKGHPVIMGRKTFESLPEKFKPLPFRPNIVISRQKVKYDGARVVDSLDKAIVLVRKEKRNRVFVIGGAELYMYALRKADVLAITHIEKDYDGDVKFPEYPKEQWGLKYLREEEDNGTILKFCQYHYKG